MEKKYFGLTIDEINELFTQLKFDSRFSNSKIELVIESDEKYSIRCNDIELADSTLGDTRSSFVYPASKIESIIYNTYDKKLRYFFFSYKYEIYGEICFGNNSWKDIYFPTINDLTKYVSTYSIANADEIVILSISELSKNDFEKLWI